MHLFMLGSYKPGGTAAPLVHHHRPVFKTQNNWRDVPHFQTQNHAFCYIFMIKDVRDSDPPHFQNLTKNTTLAISK